MAFRFKQFTVEDERSTMRIGTDAILLGAWADPGPATSILDIGTGCGVISLILAQKSETFIDAIDIDEESVKQAESNFSISPWSERLSAKLISLQELGKSSEKKYECIITNPPFFTGSLKSPDIRKNLARHTSSLSREDLVSGILHLLTKDGSFFLILPAAESSRFTTLAESAGLFIQKEMQVKPKKGNPVNRVLSRFGFDPCSSPSSEELVIRNEDSTFTKEYIDFTDDYYFSLQQGKFPGTI